MKQLDENNLRLAIQKKGHLSSDTINFLRSNGLEFEDYSKRLFSTCRNFPLEILYVRDDDIPNYVESGVVDIGIVGMNLLYEIKPKVKKMLDLNFGFCSLVVAVPNGSNIKKMKDLKNLRIATSYPVSAKNFFKGKKIPVEIIKVNGSVEIAPILGISDAIVDIVSTGRTLLMNDLRIVDTIYHSQAVLITSDNLNKKRLRKKLLKKFTI